MKNKGKICLAKGCNRPATCKGYCTKHYQQVKLKGKLKEKEPSLYIEGICKIIGCNKPKFAKGFCQNHYLLNKKEEL